MSVRRLLMGITLLLFIVAVPAVAPAAAPRTSVTDLEDEVMCPICGTLLELSSSPQADRERAFIARLVREGRTKAQIEDALVAQYGPEVLAEPSGSGFDISAWLVPALAFVVAVAALALGVRRWRRPPGGGDSPPFGRSPSPEAAERLEADLARYDL
jgi:cytochrome c-type biogenesis protein CcmH/NrfF